MRKLIAFVIVFLSSIAMARAQSADVPEQPDNRNRLLRGVAFEAMRFDEEWFPGGETHLLFPCSETFSLGAGWTIFSGKHPSGKKPYLKNSWD